SQFASLSSGAYPDITDCTIRHMSQNGIFLFPGDGGIALPLPSRTVIVIDRNTIQDVLGGPIVLNTFPFEHVMSFDVSTNSILSCPGGGVAIAIWSGVGELQVNTNQIVSSGGGISLSRGDFSASVYTAEVDGNTITNSAGGISFSSLAVSYTIEASGNQITSSGAGIELYQSS